MATDDGSRRIDGGMQPKPAIFALSRACIERGTGSSNPSPSSAESANYQFRSRQAAPAIFPNRSTRFYEPDQAFYRFDGQASSTASQPRQFAAAIAVRVGD
jgi:hypothetical protein